MIDRRQLLKGASILPLAVAVLPDTWVQTMAHQVDCNAPITPDAPWDVLYRNLITNRLVVKRLPRSEVMGDSYDKYCRVSTAFLESLLIRRIKAVIDRRKFLRAALWVAAAPMIVKASSLMKIRAIDGPRHWPFDFYETDFTSRNMIEILRGGLVHVSGDYRAIPSQWTEMIFS